MKRLFLAALLALLSCALDAASIAARSPFTQGHWWDANHPGSGLEIFSNAYGQMMAIWFTYDDLGNPIWYTSQGDVASLGTPMPLLKHQWVNGSKGDATVVGSLTLSFRSGDVADFGWQIGGKGGGMTIRPFVASGVQSEIDHTGSWFDPANSGWGVSLTEQGDILGGVLFTYDVTGAPTWLAGFQRGKSSTELFRAHGGCLGCAYSAPTYLSAGRVSFQFLTESAMTIENHLTVNMAPGVRIDGARLVQLGRAASMRAADRQLANFDSNAQLRAYLDASILNIPASPVSGADFSPAPSGPTVTFSPTNLQESGVDEADVVKSDGRFIYTYQHNNFGQRQPVIRYAEVSGAGDGVALRGTAPLSLATDTPLNSGGLYLSGDKLVSVTSNAPQSSFGVSPWVCPIAWTRGTTHVEVLAVSDTHAPASTWRADIDGLLVASRRIGDRIYIVTRFVPYLPGFAYGSTYPPYVSSNQQILAAATLDDLLPKVAVNGLPAMRIVTPANVYAPPLGERAPVADMVVVTAVDLRNPAVVQMMVTMGTVDALYASTTDLFVATSRATLRTPAGFLLNTEPNTFITDIHQLRIDPDALRLVGSGAIEGHLGNDPETSAFRMGQWNDRLRVVTSSQFMWGSAAKNRLTILEPSTIAPGMLRTISVLPNTDRPQTLGKTGEVLYGVRFVGDRLYAVTFRSIDPLYVVDLSNVADPYIAGSLDLRAFSWYLHPLANGLLLGVGKDAKPADVSGDGQFAWYQGVQLTLFDVSNPSQPREIQHVTLGKRGSDTALLRDHHALSVLPRSDGSWTLGMPIRLHDGAVESGSGDAAMYSWVSSGLLTFDVRGTTPSTASLVPRANLVTNRPPPSLIQGFDAAVTDGRSVLFANGAIYIANGQFWRLDNAGSATGPF